MYYCTCYVCVEMSKIINKPDLWNPTLLCTTINKENDSVNLKKEKNKII